MHIHWIANTTVPPPISLSGGDRIMVECIRRWSQDHKVTVYGNEGAKQLCDWFELKGIGHVTWPADHLKKFGRPFWWFMQMLNGLRGVDKIKFSPDEKHLIMAASEFHPSCHAGDAVEKALPARAAGGRALFLRAEMVFRPAGAGLHVHRLPPVSAADLPAHVCARRK